MYLGVDIGSRACKAVLMDDDGLRGQRIVDAGVAPQRTCEEMIEQLLAEAGVVRSDVAAIVATGYGRVSLTAADRAVTELSCHGRGAHYLDPMVRTVIDIGGQDSKVIQVDDAGNMLDFAMNDRCAAGTGRFMEGVARVLETDVDHLGRMIDKARAPCPINSMCAVFAESEVISLLAQGHDKENIAAGLFEAFARRVGNLAKGVGVREKVAFVGGAAKNLGLRKALSDYLAIELATIDVDPQIVGALGAALLAKDMS